MKSALTLFLVLFIPTTALATTPVSNFELDRYLGKWYEIARLDHSFERGLSHATAEYSMQDNGKILIQNKGYSEEKGKWKHATGKAKFEGASDTGYLKASFFWFFYGSYIIFELDHQDYQYAFVSGSNKKYLWLLSRTPIISEELKKQFIQQSAAEGFAIDELIWVDHHEL